MRLARYDEVDPSKALRRAFDCGEPSLNRWLAEQARQSMTSRDAVTYLLLEENASDATAGRIAGYYALSAGQVLREAVPLAIGRRAPEPIPAIRMGRFAIDRAHQGAGLGAGLLREALLSAVAAGRLIGARVMLVDAISENAAAFYQRFGFEHSPIHSMQLLRDLRVVAASAGTEL